MKTCETQSSLSSRFTGLSDLSYLQTQILIENQAFAVFNPKSGIRNAKSSLAFQPHLVKQHVAVGMGLNVL
jgi:hypothetical protein